jgi:hypothetical protein
MKVLAGVRQSVISSIVETRAVATTSEHHILFLHFNTPYIIFIILRSTTLCLRLEASNFAAEFSSLTSQLRFHATFKGFRLLD